MCVLVTCQYNFLMSSSSLWYVRIPYSYLIYLASLIQLFLPSVDFQSSVGDPPSFCSQLQSLLLHPLPLIRLCHTGEGLLPQKPPPPLTVGVRLHGEVSHSEGSGHQRAAVGREQMRSDRITREEKLTEKKTDKFCISGLSLLPYQ